MAGAGLGVMLGITAGCAMAPAVPRGGDIVFVDGLRYRIEVIPRGPIPLRSVAPGWLSHPQRGLLPLHQETEDAYLVRILEPDLHPVARPAPPTEAAERAASTAIASLQPTGQFDKVATALPRSGEWRERFALVATASGGAQLIASPARKTLTAPVSWTRDGAGTWSRIAPDFPPLRFDYGGVALGDFDADGQRDIALGMHLLGFAALRAGTDGRWHDISAGLPHSRREGERSGSGVGIVTLPDPDGDRLLLLPEHDGRQSRLASELGLAEFRWRNGRWIGKSVGHGIAGTGLRLAELPGCAPILAVTSSTNGQLPVFRRAGNDWTPVAAPRVSAPLWMVSAMRLDQYDGVGCADLVAALTERTPEGWRSRIGLWAGDGVGGWRAIALPQLPAAFALVELWAAHRGGELVILAGSAAGDLLRLQGPTHALRWVGHLPAPAWRRGCAVAQIEAIPGLDDRWVVAFAGDGDRFDPQRCRDNGGLVEVSWETAAAD